MLKLPPTLQWQRLTLTLALAIACACVGAVCSSAAALAYAQSPMQAIRTTNKRLNSLLRSQVKLEDGTPQEKAVQERLKKTVNGFLDFQELARRALGAHWEKRTPAERDEFVQILSDLIERNYLKQLRDNLNYKLLYRKEKVEGAEATVLTTVQIEKDGRTEEVDVKYQMRKTKRGWMVYDVITDDVSVVVNYRSQFNRIIRKDSYKVLVDKMRRKLSRI